MVMSICLLVVAAVAYHYGITWLTASAIICATWGLLFAITGRKLNFMVQMGGSDEDEEDDGDAPIILIRKDIDTGIYVASCHPLGILSQGNTKEEAFEALMSAIRLYAREVMSVDCPPEG
jgi:predicted RNase H-like HicB family nuclease